MARAFLTVEHGVSSLLLAFYSTLQAGLLILLVRVMGRAALTSCS
jgi:hypothetical protein